MSFTLSMSDCEAPLGAQLHGDDATVVGVSIDTRTLEPGMLYVAVRGERLDGHDYALEAAARGAAGLLAERLVEDCPLPQLVVPDTTAALGALARDWLRRHPVPVLAITGSNGKTTTREIVRTILERLGPVLCTRGNLNNDFGVPLTLLRLGPEHRYIVLEMGASRAGDIARLCAIARPDVAVVTNTAAAHLEGFGDLDGVARAKREIYADLGPHGNAVLNLDDPRCALLREALTVAGGPKVRTFGVHPDSDVRGVPGPGLQIETLSTTLRADFALAGDHNGMNALAAVAAVQCLDVQSETIVAGLEDVRAFPGRLEDKPGANGSRLIDDSYNANPDSVRAAIDTLARLPGTRHLVLGEMLELGQDAQHLHAEMGRLARRRGIERLWTVGPMAAAASEAFGVGAQGFDDCAALAAALRPMLAERHVALVKGSRGARMERAVDALHADAGEPVEVAGPAELREAVEGTEAAERPAATETPTLPKPPTLPTPSRPRTSRSPAPLRVRRAGGAVAARRGRPRDAAAGRLVELDRSRLRRGALHHAARDLLGAHVAGDLPGRGAEAHPVAGGREDRPVGA